MLIQRLQVRLVRFGQLAAECLQLQQGYVQVARVAQGTQQLFEGRPDSHQRCGQVRAELPQDGIQAAAGNPQVVKLLRVVSQPRSGLVKIPCRQVTPQVCQGNFVDAH